MGHNGPVVWVCAALRFSTNDNTSYKLLNNRAMAIDEIYKGKTRDEIIELVYTFHLQNTNGRETHDEMFKLGIEACYDELCVGECSDENAALPIQHVSVSVCAKCGAETKHLKNSLCYGCTMLKG